MSDFSIKGRLIDLHQRRIYPAELRIEKGIIVAIEEVDDAPHRYILPGFVDAHVHIESSMLTPAQFARMATTHGTVATVSDPHEIANVCGAEGVQWMVANAKTVPFKCFFGAPSCVPATGFETAGAVLDSGAIDTLLSSPDIWYLAEMMNYPGVLHRDAEVMAKIGAARKWNKPIDGHAPGLRGYDARQYASAGIITDHECTTLEEAIDKIEAGMRILIREGSAAKNFEALQSLLSSHPDSVMFCSDDKHPDDLAVGHINQSVKRALAKGHNLFHVLRAACIHPVEHYKLPVGQLRAGDMADFIVVPSLTEWVPSHTYVNGQLVAEHGKCAFEAAPAEAINNFKAKQRRIEDFAFSFPASKVQLQVIVAHDGQLLTSPEWVSYEAGKGELSSQDILKLVVVNRYEEYAKPAIAFIRGFGFCEGAIASTVAHDCHNIIAVGVDDASLCAAVNAIIVSGGGISVAASSGEVKVLPLPIAGLMSAADGYEVGRKYAELSQAAKDLGSSLHAPFMTLSFMALLVIPALKLSDKGLFDGTKFSFTELVVDEA
jgi:adenine deaminase